jgi:hypothetical protein
MDDVVERCRIAYENVIGINHLFTGDQSPVFALFVIIGLPALLFVIVLMFFLEQRSWAGTLASLITVEFAVFFYFGYAVEVFAPITDPWWWTAGTVLFAATQTMGLAIIIAVPILLIRALVRPADVQPRSWWGRLLVYLVLAAVLVAWRIASDAVPEIAAGPRGIDVTWVQQVLGTWPVGWPVDVAWWCAVQLTRLPVLIGLALLAVAGIVLRPAAQGRGESSPEPDAGGSGTEGDAGGVAGEIGSRLDQWVQVGNGPGVGPEADEQPVSAPVDDGGTVGGYVDETAADGGPGVVTALRAWRATRSGRVIGTILTYLTSLGIAGVLSVGVVVLFAYYMPYAIGISLVGTLVVLVVRRQRA